MRPRVLVVTPTKDADDQELRRCVTSVTGQVGVTVDHVVVDAGSDSEVLRGAREAGARILDAPGTSQSEAINLGVRSSDAEIVTWLGADDSLLPDMLSRAVAALERSTASWTYGPCVQLTPRGTHVFQPPQHLTPRSLEWGNVVAQPGCLIRREAWQHVEGLRSDFHYAMDADLWARLLVGGKSPVRVDDPVATFRIHAGSKSGSAPPERFLFEEHRAWAEIGWEVPAATTLGRGRWFEAGLASLDGAGHEPLIPVDLELVVSASGVTAILEHLRAKRIPPPAALDIGLLKDAPCRRRLTKAVLNLASELVDRRSRS